MRSIDIWSSYSVEEEGVMIAYTSVYGNTKKAVELLAEKLRDKGCPKVVVYDLARCDMSQAVADAFRYGKLILATTTYNAEIYPFMRTFIEHLTERNYQNRTIGLIENGSWAPLAAKIMKGMFEKSKKITWLNTTVRILSSLSAENKDELEAMANELCEEYIARSGEVEKKVDPTALFRIGYGLYVVTSNDGKKDNGLIVNTVIQLTDQSESRGCQHQQGKLFPPCHQADRCHERQLPVRGSSLLRYSRTSASRAAVRQTNSPAWRDIRVLSNGLVILPKYINAFMSLKVEQYVDLGTHGMFICSVTEARVINDERHDDLHLLPGKCKAEAPD